MKTTAEQAACRSRMRSARVRTALGMTAACGYGHYEISNVALPGFQCRHNLKYWSMDEYVGLGLSAHSFTGGIRRENTAEWERYIAGAYVCAQESGDAAERMGDYIFTALRRIKALSVRISGRGSGRNSKRSLEQRQSSSCKEDGWRAMPRRCG